MAKLTAIPEDIVRTCVAVVASMSEGDHSAAEIVTTALWAVPDGWAKVDGKWLPVIDSKDGPEGWSALLVPPHAEVPPTAQTESRGGHLLVEGRPDVERITKKEWEAIGTALGAMLAGSQDDWDMTDDEWEAVKSAHRKVGGRF